MNSAPVGNRIALLAVLAASAWGAPRRIRGPTGIFEAGTWSPDASILYFHQVVAGRYVIRRLTR